jgi:hypothetical protein
LQAPQRATGRLGRFEVIEEEDDGELDEDEEDDKKGGKKGKKGGKGRKEKVTAEMKRAARKMVSPGSWGSLPLWERGGVRLLGCLVPPLQREAEAEGVCKDAAYAYASPCVSCAIVCAPPLQREAEGDIH